MIWPRRSWTHEYYTVLSPDGPTKYATNHRRKRIVSVLIKINKISCRSKDFRSKNCLRNICWDRRAVLSFRKTSLLSFTYVMEAWFESMECSQSGSSNHADFCPAPHSDSLSPGHLSWHLPQPGDCHGNRRGVAAWREFGTHLEREGKLCWLACVHWKGVCDRESWHSTDCWAGSRNISH